MTDHPQDIFIRIKGLEVFAYHGLLPEEQENGQAFRFNLKLRLSSCPACETDDINGTVDYAAVADRVAQVATENTYQLLEKLAAVVAADLLAQFPQIDSVTVSAIKPSPPLTQPVESVAVTLRRERGAG